MPLHEGEAAPDFTLYDEERQPWTLADHRDRPVVILFFPGAFTSVCTTELNTVNNDLDRLTAGGAHVVGISTDAPSALAEFKKVNDFRFPLLSDHDADVAEAYGVRFKREEHHQGFSRIAKRAVFVVDGEGRIAHTELTAHAGVEPDYEALREAVEEASRR